MSGVLKTREELTRRKSLSQVLEIFPEDSFTEDSFKSELVPGDAIKELDKITGHLFDVVIADPPYNIGKDFGITQDTMPLDEYLAWTDIWLQKCLNLLTDNGVVYVYGFPEILARVAARYPIEEQRWLVWHYTNKATPSAQFWQRSHESILCLWKPGKPRPSLEIDQIREPYTDSFMSNVGKTRAATAGRFSGNVTGRETIYKEHKNGAMPRDVIKIPALAGGAGASERWFRCYDCGNQVFPPRERKEHSNHNVMKHPTQKPMQLTTKLIRSRINGTAGRVLIPFAGSGSECVVAQSMGIEWFGIEINPDYWNLAMKWLKCTKGATEIFS